MPTHKSAEKRIRITAKKNLQNRMVKSALKSDIKRFTAAVDAKADNAETLFNETVRSIDQAASKGVIHKNAANRKKAQMARKMQTV